MKKQIMCCVGIVMLIAGTTNCYGDYSCLDNSTNWTACTWGNTNIETCGADQGWTPVYRCKAGYYYDAGYKPGSCTSSCHKCPDDGTSNPGNNEGITSCYQKPGYYVDTTGMYQVTADCYYKE